MVPLDPSKTGGRERSGRDSGGDRESGGTDRQGDPVTVTREEWLAEAEKLYLDAIEAAGKKYVNGKIVSETDDEEKENTAEGGGKYLLKDK